MIMKRIKKKLNNKGQIQIVSNTPIDCDVCDKNHKKLVKVPIKGDASLFYSISYIYICFPCLSDINLKWGNYV